MYGRRFSQDSASRPISNVDYTQTDQHDQAYHNQSRYDQPYNTTGYGTGYAATPKKKKKTWLWILLAILALVLIAGGVVGGILGSRAAKNASASGSKAGDSAAAGTTTTTTGTAKNGASTSGLSPTATDTNGNPVYPTPTGTPVPLTKPAFTVNAALSCGDDPYSFAGGLAVRQEHPLLFAPAYKWTCLQQKLIGADGHMSSWNATIFANATKFYNLPPTTYSIDGGLSGSGVLDVAREVQLRIKHWGYAYQISGDTKWADRTWQEIVVASGNGTQSFGIQGDNWNTAHFLDLGEFTLAFAIAYDWFYAVWTPAQRNAIMWSIITLGLEHGLLAYGTTTSYGWWNKNVQGNWNCVCNAGLTAGALAIANEDPTGVASQILQLTVPNAVTNCANGPSSDGTWSETSDYWYFGSTGHSQMVSALTTATGSNHNLMDTNPGMAKSGLFHMYGMGMQGKFDYGDTGPNKYTATANALLLYGSYFKIPQFTLFQRDQSDAPEPMAMLFYDPQVVGEFYNGMALDYHFDNLTDAWASMRTSWTDANGVYVAMKAGAIQEHQTHSHMDTGDFVLDALGQRWAGELGSADYLGDGYFSTGEGQDAQRWLYYRTRTEGQNTLLLNGQNQLVTAAPTTTYDSTGDLQDALVYTPAAKSTAFFATDMSGAYGTATERAVRFINGRTQVLIQDEILVPSGQTVQWRMHTNATVTINGATATLTLGGQTLIAELLSPSGATFSQQAPVRLSTDPALPTDALSADQPNTGTVLTVTLAAGQQSIQVLFNPQYPGASSSSFVTPNSIPIAQWSLTSHP